MSQPGSPRTRMRPHGPGSPMPAPIRRERQRLLAGRSARSGRWPSRVWMMWKPLARIAASSALDRLDRRAGEREVVAHLVDIAADAAEVGLHVDDDQRRVLPGADRRCRARDRDRRRRKRLWACDALGVYLVIVSSAGAPTSVRLGEQVTIMMSKRQDVGRGVEEIIALGDADRLQRRPERGGAAEQQRRRTGTASDSSARRSPARPR